MAKKFPIVPMYPERICWGCDKYCPTDSLACGNGSERVQHPCELFGDDWADWDPLQSQTQRQTPFGVRADSAAICSDPEGGVDGAA